MPLNYSNQGEKISTNCSTAAWWTWSPEIVQDVNIMASMSKFKLVLRAGPFYSLSMSSFLTVGIFF